MKRNRSSSPASGEEESPHTEKRWCPETDLLTSLTGVLSEIRSTPSTSLISAEVMETFKVLMLQIEELSSDETNVEGQLVKDESERCLMSWLEDLVAQCEADGELDDIFVFDDNDDGDTASEGDDDDDELVLALTFEQDQDGSSGDDGDDDDYVSCDSNHSHQHTLTTHHFVVTGSDDQDEDDDEEIIIVDDDDDDDTLDPRHIQVMA